jgi:hypothetical protein
VARDTNISRLRGFALVGARARLEELRKEEAALLSDFPELFRGPRPAPTGVRKKRGRPTMTAAQKKAVSERMKKYWADRKKKSEKK